MAEAVIVAATRTPIGRAMKGSLTQVRPDDLAAGVIHAALAQVPALDPHTLDDLYLGCAQPWGEQGFNLARVVSVLLGWDELPGATVNRFCASSMQTTRMAFHAIRAGEGDAFISAGVESISRSVDLSGPGGKQAWHHPDFAIATARSADLARSGTAWADPREDHHLPDVYVAMGHSAENVASHLGVSRQRQDEWALLSQHRAQAAIAAGITEQEITPVPLPDGSVLIADDCPRAGVTAEALAGLPPAFREQGSVTAGNCCPLNDGAAALVITSDVRARELGLTPLARIVATGVSALSPEIMGLGPVQASRRALARAGMSIRDMDLYEINEAFAVQVLGSADALGMDPDRLNVHGGAIALGHPFGATGARIIGTLMTALQVHDGQFGLASLCVGGGQGMALILERLS